MKILIIPPYKWKTRHGGAETFTHHLITSLKEISNTDVKIFDFKNDVNRNIEDIFFRIPLSVNRPDEIFEKLYNEYLIIVDSLFKLKHESYDVIHLINWTFQWIIVALLGVPTIISVHQVANNRFIREALRLISKFNNVITVAPSTIVKKSYVDYQINIDKVIPHPFASQNISKIKYNKSSTGALLWVGRITEDKDPITAINIARSLDMPIRIVGPVVDEKYFEEKMRNRIDEKKVRYIGPINWKEDKKILESTIALLITTAFPESFSYVAIESLCLGIPVITKNYLGIEQYLSYGKNYIFAWKNESDAKWLIEKVIQARTQNKDLISNNELLTFREAAKTYSLLYREIVK